jgi:hypothetical protein
LRGLTPVLGDQFGFIDELAGLLHCSITVYQREKLQAALTGAIDARVGTPLGRLPA